MREQGEKGRAGREGREGSKKVDRQGRRALPRSFPDIQGGVGLGIVLNFGHKLNETLVILEDKAGVVPLQCVHLLAVSVHARHIGEGRLFRVEDINKRKGFRDVLQRFHKVGRCLSWQEVLGRGGRKMGVGVGV